MTHIKRLDEMTDVSLENGKSLFGRDGNLILPVEDVFVADAYSIRDALLKGYAIKCNGQGDFEISEVPYDTYMKKYKPLPRTGGFVPNTVIEKMPRFWKIGMDAAEFDEAINELIEDGVERKVLRMRNGYKVYFVPDYVLRGDGVMESRLNESYSGAFLQRLVQRIVRSKTNNESFKYLGHDVDVQSGTRDYASVTVDNNISFSIDYQTGEVHFESVGGLNDTEVDLLVSALHNELDDRWRKVKVSFSGDSDSYGGEDYKLTKRDIAALKKWGYRDDDMKLIQQCFDEDGFDMRDRFERRIDAETAIRMLGKSEFLSGIGRSCFHWSAERGKGNNAVSFDTSEWHKK